MVILTFYLTISSTSTGIETTIEFASTIAASAIMMDTSMSPTMAHLAKDGKMLETAIQGWFSVFSASGAFEIPQGQHL